jgi:hypothetical protein
MSFLFGSRSSKTFKPKKNIPEGTHQYELMKHAAATLGSGNLRLAVMLPEGEDLNEWVAVNSTSPSFARNLYTFFLQLWTSSTRSTCFTAPSLSFALKRAAPSCRPAQNTSTTGRTATPSRNPSSVRRPNILIIS